MGSSDGSEIVTAMPMMLGNYKNIEFDCWAKQQTDALIFAPLTKLFCLKSF